MQFTHPPARDKSGYFVNQRGEFFYLLSVSRRQPFGDVQGYFFIDNSWNCPRVVIHLLDSLSYQSFIIIVFECRLNGKGLNTGKFIKTFIYIHWCEVATEEVRAQSQNRIDWDLNSFLQCM